MSDATDKTAKMAEDDEEAKAANLSLSCDRMPVSVCDRVPVLACDRVPALVSRELLAAYSDEMAEDVAKAGGGKAGGGKAGRQRVFFKR